MPIFTNDNPNAEVFLGGKRFTKLPYKTDDPAEVAMLRKNAGVTELTDGGAPLVTIIEPTIPDNLQEASGVAEVDEYESLPRLQLFALCKERRIITKPAMGRTELQGLLRRRAAAETTSEPGE
jgi:hypothetical protein